MQNITIINHTVRLSLGMSCNEYCIIDFFYTDWRAANTLTRQELADRFGLTKPTITLMLRQFQEEGYLVSDGGKFLTVTEKWSSLFEGPAVEKPATAKEREVWKP